MTIKQSWVPNPECKEIMLSTNARSTGTRSGQTNEAGETKRSLEAITIDDNGWRRVARAIPKAEGITISFWLLRRLISAQHVRHTQLRYKGKGRS
jgi:hypothetical protein